MSGPVRVSIPAALPHRYPMLLLDRVHHLEPGVRCVATKVVSLNEPWYAGVGPDDDEATLAYPPVLLLESWLQAATMLLPAQPGGRREVALLGSVSEAVFGEAVLPGDVIEHEARVVRALTDTVIVEGYSSSGGERRLTVGRAILARRAQDKAL